MLAAAGTCEDTTRYRISWKEQRETVVQDLGSVVIYTTQSVAAYMTHWHLFVECLQLLDPSSLARLLPMHLERC